MFIAPPLHTLPPSPAPLPSPLAVSPLPSPAPHPSPLTVSLPLLTPHLSPLVRFAGETPPLVLTYLSGYARPTAPRPMTHRSRPSAPSLPALCVAAAMTLSLLSPLSANAQNVGGAPTAQYPGRYPYTAADIHFVSGMIGHHAQALVMAGWAPTHGASRPIQVLCERIINAQTDEITLMQTWLRDRNQPVPEAKAGPMKMMMDGVEHDMLMPGMLSEAQMKE